MSIQSGIYAIVNQTNGKRYVGSAINIHQRWGQHRWQLRSGKHHCRHLQRAWDKYGEATFSFVVLELVLPAFLLDIEQKHLDKNRNGYNTAKWADASMRGRCLSAEHRAKISMAAQHKSDEHRAKLSRAATGRIMSDEAKAKAGAAHRGKIVFEETRAKISAAGKGRKLSPANIVKLQDGHRRYRSQDRGKTVSEETRAKISAGQIGRILSPENLAKMLAGQKRYHQQKRNGVSQ